VVQPDPGRSEVAVWCVLIAVDPEEPYGRIHVPWEMLWLRRVDFAITNGQARVLTHVRLLEWSRFLSYSH